MANVSVDPVAKTCNPPSVKARGQSAMTVFQIVQDSTKAWVWGSPPIQFGGLVGGNTKATPSTGCFTWNIPGNSGNLQVTSRNSQQSDYGTWPYTLYLTNTQTNATVTIDPDIVNEANNAAP